MDEDVHAVNYEDYVCLLQNKARFFFLPLYGQNKRDGVRKKCRVFPFISRGSYAFIPSVVPVKALYIAIKEN